MADLDQVQNWVADAKSLHRAIFSGKRKSFNPRFERIDIRPVVIRDELLLQVVSHDGKQDHTKNLKPSEFEIETFLAQGYANIRIERVNENIDIKVTKKGKFGIHRETAASQNPVDLSHDRKKIRRLEISDSIFKYLGIADEAGKLIPRQSDKFHQVDDFLRIIDDILPGLGSGPISIVDLGCGNAYLTFAVHRYLSKKGILVNVTGVDSRRDACERNSRIADDAGLSTSIKFETAKISDVPIRSTSLVIALHACDTATDDALIYAIRSQAKAILVSPCCHHDLNRQLSSPDSTWKMMFRHGITKERFADLLTDSLRAEILRLLGYRSEIIEFVSLDHTPRNLLIRAVQSDFAPTATDFANIDQQIARWSINPYLWRELSTEISARRSALLS